MHKIMLSCHLRRSRRCSVKTETVPSEFQGHTLTTSNGDGGSDLRVWWILHFGGSFPGPSFAVL